MRPHAGAAGARGVMFHGHWRLMAYAWLKGTDKTFGGSGRGAVLYGPRTIEGVALAPTNANT
jgi:hypothetical protein